MMTTKDDIVRQKGMYEFVANFAAEFRKRYGDDFKIIVKPIGKNRRKWRTIRARRHQ